MKSKIPALLLIILFCLSSSFPVSAQTATQYPVYVMQGGDTLYSVAMKFGITLDELIAANSIADPNFISTGQSLYIPSFPGITGTISEKSVQPGESLNSLVVKYRLSADIIARLNGLTSPGQIVAGFPLFLVDTDTGDSRVPVAVMGSSMTLLESAAINNTTAWNLLRQNALNSQSTLLTGDTVYAKKGDSIRQISPVAPALTDISISPLPFAQGATIEITVDSPQSVTLDGSLNGMPLHFFKLEGNKQVALQGIDAMAEVGLTPLTLSGTFADGSTFSTQQSILLASGGFEIAAPLTVDPSLIDPTITGPEDNLVISYTSVVTPDKYWSGIFTQPGEYDDFTAYFGERRTYNDGAYFSFHGGVDFAGGEGLPIKAAADGVVVYTGLLQVRGNATIIDHGWGVYTAYFHQSEISVQIGDRVKAGDIIGYVGHTGRVDDSLGYQNAGAHLHWEVWVNGIQVDPLIWLEEEFP